MRQERTVQASLFDFFADHEIGGELKAMSQWLDEHRELIGGGGGFAPTRRRGNRARRPAGESVLRCAILKQHRQLSYEGWRFILKTRPRFAPSRGCRFRGRRRSRFCTGQSAPSGPKPGRRSIAPCWPARASGENRDRQGSCGSTARSPLRSCPSRATAVFFGMRSA
jgi:hypothetical protein